MQVLDFFFGKETTTIELFEVELGPVVQEEYLNGFKQILDRDAKAFDNGLVG